MKSINWSHLIPKYEGKWVAFATDQTTILGSGLYHSPYEEIRETVK